MRQLATIFMLFTCMLFTFNTAHAGFLVKKHTLGTQHTQESVNRSQSSSIAKIAYTLTPSQHQCENEGDGCNCKCHKRATYRKCGSAGTTSLWLSILGMFYMPPLLIAGLAYGAHGMRPGACKQNRAMAGIILGTAGLFFWTLIIVAATLW